MSLRDIETIQDMYNGAMTIVRTVVGKTNDFSITVSLYQGSALSPYLFALMQDEIPWCMLFADDIVQVVETKLR